MTCPGGSAAAYFEVEGLAANANGRAAARRLSRRHVVEPSPYADAPSVVIPERPSSLEVIRTYTVLGVEHILLGIDHLLFVLALLLLVRGVGRLIATVRRSQSPTASLSARRRSDSCACRPRLSKR